MNMNDDQVPTDDSVAAAMRSALERDVGSEPSIPIAWTTVLSRARRVALVRRVVAGGVGALVVLFVTVAAFASTGHQRSISVTGSGSTTSSALESTTTSTQPTATTEAPAPTTVPSAACVSCATPTTTTAIQHPVAAQVGDFTGHLDHWGDTCGPCPSNGFGKNIQLTIRNNTDHAIDLSTSAPVRVASICSTNMTADGHLTAPLPAVGVAEFADWAIDAAGHELGVAVDTLVPGAEATTTQWAYGGGGADPGTATCEAAIVSTSDGSWRNDTLSVVARLDNIPTYSFQVVASPTTTSAPPTTQPSDLSTTSAP